MAFWSRKPAAPDNAALARRLDELELGHKTFLIEANKLLEEIIDVAELVEHKRRQITSAAARAKGLQEAEDRVRSSQPELPNEETEANRRSAGKSEVARRLRGGLH